MALNKLVLVLSTGIAAALLAACASTPASAPASTPAAVPAAPAAASTAATATEADTASLMEKKFQEAARSYKVVQKDGKPMYCKRERVIGTTIPTMQCFTEAQLRTRVENTEEIKKNMRRGGGSCVQTGGCGGG
jgi:hypothetical protein